MTETKGNSPSDLTLVELLILLAFMAATLAFFVLPLFSGPRE